MAGQWPGYRREIVSGTQGAGDMQDQDQWTSYSHWGMFQTETEHSH